MATVSKTWVFNTTAENITVDSNGGTGTAVVNYNSSLSSLNIAFAGSSAEAEEFSIVANATGTTETWESWGVPSNSTVNSVEIVGYEYQINEIVGLASDSFITITLIDSDGNAIIPSNLVSETMTGDRNTWIAGSPAGSVSVNTNKRASNTSVRLRLIVDYSLDGSEAASLQNNFDNIELSMTYTAASGGTSKRRFILIT